MRDGLATAAQMDDDADDGDWTIPEDRFSPDTQDPWMLGVEELVAEEEHPFQYPAGLP